MSERLLLIRLGSLGDVVHTLPVVPVLRAAFPEARLDWLIERRWQDIVELHPALTNVIPVDTYRWRRALWSGASFRELIRTVLALHGNRYDLVLDLQGLYKSALFSFLSGARRRLGFATNALREPGASIFYSQQAAADGIHVVERNLSLARAAGAGTDEVVFDIPVLEEEEVRVREQLESQQAGEFFVVSPGGGWGAKRWPLERYAGVARHLISEHGLTCFLNLGPGEEHLAAEFQRHAPEAKTVHFPLTLRKLVALMRRAKLFLSGDTGPLHIAAAVGTPLVALYGPTDPRRNGPYPCAGAAARVICHAEPWMRSYRREEKVSPAMLAIGVAEVCRAADKVLEARRG